MRMAMSIIGLDVQLGSLSHKFQSFDFVTWVNVPKDKLLEEISLLKEDNLLGYRCDLASAVHISMWGLNSQDDRYKIRVFRRLNALLAAFSNK